MKIGTKIRATGGQASVETAVVLAAVVIPAALGLLLVTQAVWTWAGMVHLTRLGAVYAATHCWQDSSGSNVVTYMQARVPPMIDARQIVNGPAQIQVQYFTQDSANRQTVPFECAESCSSGCMPDAVTITVTGYQLAGLPRFIGFSALAMPAFSTTMHLESHGANPDTGEVIP